MEILYISTSCSENKYQEIFRLRKVKAIEPQQKFNWLIVSGISSVENTKVTAMCGLPVSHSTCDQKKFCYQQERVSDSLTFEYLPFRNGKYTRLYDWFWQSKRFIKNWIIERQGRPCCIVVDVLSPFLIMGGFGIAKKNRVPVVGIITDLPELATGMKERQENVVKKAMLWLIHKINTRTLKKYSGYISLTQSINDVVNGEKKPEIVIEGSVSKDNGYNKERPKRPYTVVYAGGVYAKYGIKNLVEAFAMMENDSELHIYGDGTYVDAIREVSLNHPNIQYKGMVSLEEIVEVERQATLLINPRPSSEEFSKFSFPSKTLEYMSSGTPLLSTRLPGIPQEYYQYIYSIDDESVDGIAKALRQVLSLSPDELALQGKKAYDFVINEKNNVRQGARIVEFLKESFYA